MRAIALAATELVAAEATGVARLDLEVVGRAAAQSGDRATRAEAETLTLVHVPPEGA